MLGPCTHSLDWQKDVDKPHSLWIKSLLKACTCPVLKNFAVELTIYSHHLGTCMACARQGGVYESVCFIRLSHSMSVAPRALRVQYAGMLYICVYTALFPHFGPSVYSITHQGMIPSHHRRHHILVSYSYTVLSLTPM